METKPSDRQSAKLLEDELKEELDGLTEAIRHCEEDLRQLYAAREKAAGLLKALAVWLGEPLADDVAPRVLVASRSVNEMQAVSATDTPRKDEGIHVGKSATNHPVLKYVCEILKDYPDGLHYSKVFTELVNRGIRIPGQKPENNLATYMSRSDLLERVGRGTYRLKQSSQGGGPEFINTKRDT